MPYTDPSQIDQKIDEMIKSGQLSSMSECAMGSAIADKESENTLNKKSIDQ